MPNNDNLKLENQLCFRLYSLTKLMNRHYSPVLKQLGLTYSQYLVMLVLWEHNNTRSVVSVKHLGDKLDLDSGTLSPLLKRLEKQDLLSRVRNSNDERSVEIKLTQAGCQLKAQAINIPAQMFSVTGMSIDDLQGLTTQLDTLLTTMKTR
ncbi:MarR family transcriptional regulator [Colwellia sp. KU-HH00111]|uniref:MarR family winged helix-turn-helix transcriptional regulator n=1 Tax=Colwellia sp. KU-HH00111 TaxID=3127652 RepID=UPI003103AD78